jgi:polar amino acid transport system permease protein
VLSLLVSVALALARLSSSWTATWFAAVIVSVARNTPLIVQVSMFYFVLAPVLGIGRFWSGVSSLVLFESAFLSEIVRSGILSVPSGQWEAGAALGLPGPAVLARVVAPQAVRTMLPALTNAAISIIKDTSIVSVIALYELTTAGRNAISDTYMSFEIWLTVAAIYLALTVSLSLLAARLEKRLSRPFLGHLQAKRT